VIDPREGQQRADFFRLETPTTAGAQYDLFATEEDKQVKSQVLPGFWLRPEWLWQADELDPLMILGEIRGIPPAQMQRIRQLLIDGAAAEQ
jgi:hypothetical protein